MKSADAKAPKFDSKWWIANKAKAADADGGFAKALKKYEDEKKSFATASSNVNGVKTTGIEAALKGIKTEAAKKQADPKLGALQKETKDALAAYGKLVDAALKDISSLAASPIMKMTAVDLVRHAPQHFEPFCKLRYNEENFAFVATMVNKQKPDKKMYETYIKAGSKSEINISAKQREPFDKVAAIIAGNPTLDTPASWARAPWDAALKEISKVLNDNTVGTTFRPWVTGKLLAPKLP